MRLRHYIKKVKEEPIEIRGPAVIKRAPSYYQTFEEPRIQLEVNVYDKMAHSFILSQRYGKDIRAVLLDAQLTDLLSDVEKAQGIEVIALKKPIHCNSNGCEIDLSIYNGKILIEKEHYTEEYDFFADNEKVRRTRLRKRY